MDEQPTCGRGLAEHSAVPAALGDVVTAMGENLEVHRRTLDPSDAHARREDEVYADLARQHREIAARLQDLARRMAAQRDLPMGRHDEKALASPEVVAVFRKLIAAEEALQALLQSNLETYRKMLEGGSTA
jgi:hypothetical protein